MLVFTSNWVSIPVLYMYSWFLKHLCITLTISDQKIVSGSLFFMFKNVVYRATVYGTGVCLFVLFAITQSTFRLFQGQQYLINILRVNK